MGPIPLMGFHKRVVCETFRRRMSDKSGLLLFTILHCYQIKVAGVGIVDVRCDDDGPLLAPLTQRGCGEVVASMWTGKDDPRGSCSYWYFLWNEWGSYSRFDRLTPEERARMRRMMAELERHPFVAWLIPDDFDPAADPE